MGVIQRQSIKNSLVNYLGVAIGAVSVIFIYPLIAKEDLGAIQFALGTAILFAPIAGFAINMTTVRFFPFFKDDAQKNNGFLFLMSAATFLSTSIFAVVVYAFKAPISDLFQSDKQLFLNTLPYILAFTSLISFGNLFQSYTTLFNRIVVPALFQNLLIKIAQPILVLLFSLGLISFATVYKGMGLALSLMVMGLIGYLIFLKQFNLTPQFKSEKKAYFKEMLDYSAFNIIVVLGGVMAQRIDALLIPPLLGFGALAVFSIPSFIAEAIDVPRKALSSISAPLIAEAIAVNDTEKVRDIYQRSALLQLIIGSFLLVGAWVCADALFDLMPKNGDTYRAGKIIILILGLARVADMASGPNAEILSLSPLYRFNFVSFITLAALNLGLNLLFIKYFYWGIMGSALATLIAITVINAWRLLYIYQKMRIQPLQPKMLIVVALAFVAYLAAAFTPSVHYPILTILLKGLVLTAVYGSGIVYFKVSNDVNDMVRKIVISDK
jgi:O-antigen/teichoic acid export membrane protein